MRIAYVEMNKFFEPMEIEGIKIIFVSKEFHIKRHSIFTGAQYYFTCNDFRRTYWHFE